MSLCGCRLVLRRFLRNGLTLHAPLQKDKVLNRVREIRGGRLNDPNFGSRLRGEGEYAGQLKKLFRGDLPQGGIECFASYTRASEAFRRPGSQMTLFG